MKRQIWCTSFVSKSKTIRSWRSNDGNGYENFTEVWIRAASIFIALIPSCSIRSIVVKRRGNSGTPEGGEGKECLQGAFLSSPPRASGIPPYPFSFNACHAGYRKCRIQQKIYGSPNSNKPLMTNSKSWELETWQMSGKWQRWWWGIGVLGADR